MASVRMRNPEDGGVYEFDEKYAQEYAGKGWKAVAPVREHFRATRTGPTLSGAMGAAPAPAADTMPAQDLDSMLREAALTSNAGVDTRPVSHGPTPGEFFRATVPSLVAGGATMLAPEATIPAALLRMAIAGTAGAGTDAAIQSVRGEPVDASSLGRGAFEALTQGFGDALAPWVNKLAHGLMGSALNVGKGPASDAVEMASRLKGSHVPYDQANLVEQALKERVAPGPTSGAVLGSYPETGSERMVKLTSEPMKERAAILAKFDADPNVRAKLSDFTNGYADLRQELGAAKNPRINKWLERRIQEFADEMKVSVKGRNGKVVTKWKAHTPSEVQDLVEKWAKEAEKVYKNPSASAASRLEAEFKAAVAESGRQWLRDLTPPSVPGGTGTIESLNRRYRSLLPLEDAVQNAELPRTSLGSLKDMNPLHLAAPGTRGRAALMLTEPWVTPAVRQAPRAAGASLYAIMQLLRSAQMRNADSADSAEVAP